MSIVKRKLQNKNLTVYQKQEPKQGKLCIPASFDTVGKSNNYHTQNIKNSYHININWIYPQQQIKWI